MTNPIDAAMAAALDPASSSTSRPWPVLDPLALYGPIGEAVKVIEPESEADPVALLVSLLTGFGALAGAGPHVYVDHTEHAGRLFSLIVGDTSAGAKGSSFAAARLVLKPLDPIFWDTRRMAGFGSGEILIDAVADGDGDGGANDKRLLVIESEYTRVLRAASREGSTLSPVIRAAWDGDRMESRSRARTSVATGAHVCMVAHVVPDELRRYTAESDVAGGSANRMLYVCSRRSKRLPEGGGDVSEALAPIVSRLRANLATSRKVGRVTRTPEAVGRWAEIYHALADDAPGGTLGAVTTRGAPYVLRLALLYALADGERVINLNHLEAAYSVWCYSRASAEYIFGDAVGDRLAERLLMEIRRSPAGITASDLERAARHVTAERRGLALALLVERGLATVAEVETGGRPATIYTPVSPEEVTR